MYIFKPTPSPLKSTTEETPIKIPREVSAVRILFLLKSSKADVITNIITFMLFIFKQALVFNICYFSIMNDNLSVGSVRNFLFVSNDNNGFFIFFIKFINEI